MAESHKTWSTPVRPEEKQAVPCNICGSRSFKASLSCDGFSYVKCLICGLVQMNPQPLKTEVKLRYDQHYGEDYLDYQLKNERAFLDLGLLALGDVGFYELERELLEKKEGPQRVLDIGCATGSLLSLLRERGWETLGVEISGPQAEYASLKRKLDVKSISLEENNFPASYFNVVLASHLIEHLNDPAAMAAEVHRILSPSGHFFITTPNISGFQARLFKSRWRSVIFDHLYLFSARTLSKLLERKGFVIEDIVTWGGLAAGTAPRAVKSLFDKAAKTFGFGDVMIVRAAKKEEKVKGNET